MLVFSMLRSFGAGDISNVDNDYYLFTNYLRPFCEFGGLKLA